MGNYEKPHEIYCSKCDGAITEGRSEKQVVTNWNTRPIEDALNKRIAELEAENERLKEELQYEKTRSQLNLEAEERRMLNITYYCAEIDRLNARIAELETEIDQLTTHSDIERQDDKSPNDTQTQTVVYRKESEE